MPQALLENAIDGDVLLSLTEKDLEIAIENTRFVALHSARASEGGPDEVEGTEREREAGKGDMRR